jgi:hypothetical protein
MAISLPQDLQRTAHGIQSGFWIQNPEQRAQALRVCPGQIQRTMRSNGQAVDAQKKAGLPSMAKKGPIKTLYNSNTML